MADFLLIHGAWHGAWCWEAVISALGRRGHRAHAIDLPGSGDDPTAAGEVSLTSCSQRIVDALGRFENKAWLIGHSLAGAAITQASEVAPDKIEALVYLAASMPRHGQSHLDAVGAAHSTALDNMQFEVESGYAYLPEPYRVASFYNTCASPIYEAALSRLCFRQPLRPAVEPVSLPRNRAGQAPRFYVECLQDNAIPIASQRSMQANHVLSGVASLDTDHSPFLSAPEALASALDGFVRHSRRAADGQLNSAY